MSRSPTPASAPTGIGLQWIALSAAVGATGMWFVLSHGANRDADPAPDRTAIVATTDVTPAPEPEPVPLGASAAASPWPAAPVAVTPAHSTTPQSPVVRVRREDSALPSPEMGPLIGDPADYALDDATLSRRARTQFGHDCPGIVERRPRRSGRFEVICSNGLRLSVNLMGDGPPGITLANRGTRPHRVRSAAKSYPEEYD